MTNTEHNTVTGNDVGINPLFFCEHTFMISTQAYKNGLKTLKLFIFNINWKKKIILYPDIQVQTRWDRSTKMCCGISILFQSHFQAIFGLTMTLKQGWNTVSLHLNWILCNNSIRWCCFGVYFILYLKNCWLVMIFYSRHVCYHCISF